MCVAIGFKSAVKIQMRRAGRDLSIPLERESERERKGRKKQGSSEDNSHCRYSRGHKNDSGDGSLSLCEPQPFPLVNSRVLTSQKRSYKPSFSTPREGSADLQRKVDCSAAMETGLVLNPIIKQRLSNNRSRPTCTKDILGCGLIPGLCRTDFALCKVI